MKPAREETGVQAPIAAVTRGGAQLLTERQIGAPCGRWCCGGLAGRQRDVACQRDGSERSSGHGVHRRHPPEGADERLIERREDELSDATPGIDEARCEGSTLGRDSLRGSADENRKASRARARG